MFQVKKGNFFGSSFLLIFIFLVAGQQYNAYCAPEEIISGNDAIFKCNIPSFVSDFVAISSWVDSEGNEYFAEKNHGKLRKQNTEYLISIFYLLTKVIFSNFKRSIFKKSIYSYGDFSGQYIL